MNKEYNDNTHADYKNLLEELILKDNEEFGKLENLFIFVL